ncbi:hypothetical protein G7Y79_00004g014170 [Physcia stellaris]|nr:hypothetical protein G7Y79_00004g014170 [Physcia stellaris]
MAINTLDPEGSPVAGPWILACDYCRWSTLDMGVQFDKPAHIHEQITKTLAERAKSKQSAGVLEGKPEVASSDDRPDAVFAALKKFTSSQIASASSTNPLMTPGGSYNYDSPSSLARIMSLYTGQGSYGKKNTSKSAPMRGSADASEGLQVINPAVDVEAVRKLREQGFTGTSSIEQRSTQRHPPHFVDDLLPVPTRLVTKRSKRCGTCRHILVKPEAKVASTRYRIRLIAVNYIPTMSLKALQIPRPTTTSPTSVTPSMADLNALSPLKAIQFLLTLKNPLFDPIKVTLATPTHTPGSFSHKVTILCPQFDIGANTDAWDEALAGGEIDLKPSSKILSTGNITNAKSENEVTRVAEAGKVWDKGRNWATVVVEVVCAAIDEKSEGEQDEDLLEIPIFVRVEYETDVEKDEGGGGEKGGREKIELAYWTVLGVGKVARMSGMIHSV